MIGSIQVALIVSALALVAYTYFVYPLVLKLLATLRPPSRATQGPAEWPTISITVPVYNEEAQIRAAIESLLQLDYPFDKRQILIVSDASSDRTDEIVAEFADRGVELLRLPQRVGKTAAENAARTRLRGEIVVNTDASVRIHPHALKPLIASFTDPTVGVASGRDISVARLDDQGNLGERGYVGYEMWVRDLETRVSGIIGASGCFYAIRADLHMHPVPEALSRDFCAALGAREKGYRAVSVENAICFVPRGPSLRREYRRKVRTMTRGIQTLLYKRHLLNPFRYGAFAWMLFSHKLCRWLVPWALITAAACVGLLSLTESWARWGVAVVALAGLLGGLGWNWPRRRRMPRVLALASYFIAGNVAAVHAWIQALRGKRHATWDPTRREVVGVGS